MRNAILGNDLKKQVLTCVFLNYSIEAANELKVLLTPKYFFRLNKSLHLFEMHCAFLN